MNKIGIIINVFNKENEVNLNEIPYQIINKYNIKLLILFGSTGTKFERKDSDLDLAFLSENMLTEEEEYNMLSDLQV